MIRVGANIPGGNNAIQVELKNCVVNDKLHETTIASFTLQQSRLGKLTLGDIAGDFGKPDQFAIVVLDRVDDDGCPKPGAVLSYAPAFCVKSALFPRRR